MLQRLNNSLPIFQVHEFSSLVPYSRYRTWQGKLKQLRSEKKIRNQLILLQHEHVYTTGRRQTWKDNLQWPQSRIENELGVEIVQTDRGGDVTYHGPGTLMMYCIADLRDFPMTVREYVDALEDVLVETAAAFGVPTEGRREGMRGIWTTSSTNPSAKMGAVGVAASRYIVTHGAALNVSTDLRYFEPIVACGLQGAAHTTLSKEMSRRLPMWEVQRVMIHSFQKRFHTQMIYDGTSDAADSVEQVLRAAVSHESSR